jgi:uncharacterized membrane protein
MKVFFRYFFIVLSVAIVGILFWASLEKLINLSLVSSVPDGHVPQRIDLHYKDHLLLAYVHIVPGMLFLLLGAHQLIPYFRKRNYPRHRLIGKLFLILSAIIFSTAIVLGVVYPFGDYLESIVTVVFGIFLLFCTYRAYQSARGQQFIAHRNWVTRIYFIAIAVSTIRGLVALCIISGLGNMQSVFGLAFLIAFVIHTFLVELWIKYLAD